MISNVYKKVIGCLWLALVATLPITSLPLVAKILHTSSVAPASLIFLGALCVLWLPVYLKKDGKFPFQTKIVLVFLFFALISTFLSFFYFLPAYKDNGLLSSVLEGVAILVVGILFYLITVIAPNSNSKLRNTLRVINWSGAVMIFWALLFQVVTYAAPGNIVNAFRSIQSHFSTSMLYVNRASGFASEPSWLANILNIVYLPYWLSATISRFTAHPKKIWKLSFENLLLIGGGITLFATFSRAGLVAFLLVLAFLFIRFNIWAIRKISQKWSSSRLKIFFNIGFVLLVVLIYILVVFGSLYAFSKFDPRMAQVFSIEVLKQGGLAKYFEVLQFGERVTYWQTGWRIFIQYPIFGVGLGNAGFFFQNLLPDNAWQLTEVRRLLYSSAGLMNVKSMWLRILAELGIVGFSVFVVFLITSGLTAKELVSRKSEMDKTIGWMGIFMLIAFLIEGFSVDSFALPYLWFTLGLVAADWRWSNNPK
jgi:O-antigen ligase